MSELEKKAKTGNFIKDLVLRYDSAKEHLWVRLEDAQKEIDRLNYLLLKYNQEAVDYEQEVESERLELKQKLQQILDYYSLVDDHGVALTSKRKLEELLKEA